MVTIGRNYKGYPVYLVKFNQREGQIAIKMGEKWENIDVMVAREGLTINFLYDVACSFINDSEIKVRKVFAEARPRLEVIRGDKA